MLRQNVSRFTRYPLLLSALALLLLLVFLFQYLREKRGRRTRVEWAVLLTLLAGYGCVYVYLTLINRVHMAETHLLPHLFSSYARAFAWDGGLRIINQSSARMIVLNILAYMPLGMLLPCLLGDLSHPCPITLTAGALLSLLTEVAQYVFRLGYSEADDLLNNVLGTLLGMALFLIARGAARRLAHRRE